MLYSLLNMPVDRLHYVPCVQWVSKYIHACCCAAVTVCKHTFLHAAVSALYPILMLCKGKTQLLSKYHYFQLCLGKQTNTFTYVMC